MKELSRTPLSKRWIVLRRWYRGRLLEIVLALALTAVALAFAATRVASAEEGGIAASDAWARPSIGMTGTSAAYLTLINSGSSSDVLREARSDAAGAVELHSVVRDGDVMRMRRLEDGLAIGSGETVQLQPGGAHIMLMGLRRKLEEGETFPLTLVFERAGEMVVQVRVQRRPAEHAH